MLRKQLSSPQFMGILWLLVLIGLLVLAGFMLPTLSVYAGITPTPTSGAPTDTPAPPDTPTPPPPATSTPKPDKDDDDESPPPPPPPADTAVPVDTPTPTVEIPSVLPQTGGSSSTPPIAIVVLGILLLPALVRLLVSKRAA